MYSSAWAARTAKQRIKRESVTIQHAITDRCQFNFYCGSTNQSFALKFWVHMQNLSGFYVTSRNWMKWILFRRQKGLLWVWPKCDTWKRGGFWIVTLQKSIHFSALELKKSLKIGTKVPQLVVHGMEKKDLLIIKAKTGLKKNRNHS